MSTDKNIYDTVIDYFEIEFDDVKKRLETGELSDFKERVLVSQKITDALQLLSPYVRNEWRARHLVKHGEQLRRELLSVRDMIYTKPLTLLILFCVMRAICNA